jgi:glycosyltransferase involved in cell wall biosynthesis
MASTRRILIGLPAYNEEIALPRLLARIAALPKSPAEAITVVLYNDGSADATLAIAREWQARLPLVILDGVVNKGLGAGLRALVGHAVANAGDDDVLVVMDCDDTHDPAQIADMLARLNDGADIVIGSRYVRGALVQGVPPAPPRHRTWRCGVVQASPSGARRMGLYLQLSRVSRRRAQARSAPLRRQPGRRARLCLHGRAAAQTQRARRAVRRNSAATALRSKTDRNQDGCRRQRAAALAAARPLAAARV